MKSNLRRTFGKNIIEVSSIQTFYPSQVLKVEIHYQQELTRETILIFKSQSSEPSLQRLSEQFTPSATLIFEV